MLFHFSCPYEKVSKQSMKNILTQALNSDNSSYERLGGGRTLPQCIN